MSKVFHRWHNNDGTYQHEQLEGHFEGGSCETPEQEAEANRWVKMECKTVRWQLERHADKKDSTRWMMLDAVEKIWNASEAMRQDAVSRGFIELRPVERITIYRERDQVMLAMGPHECPMLKVRLPQNRIGAGGNTLIVDDQTIPFPIWLEINQEDQDDYRLCTFSTEAVLEAVRQLPAKSTEAVGYVDQDGNVRIAPDMN